MSTPGDRLARPVGDPAAINELYENWVDDYDDDVERWGYATPQRVARYVVAGGIPDGPVFDAGCGTGLSGLALRAVGVQAIIGADFSPASVAAARARDVYTDLFVLDLNDPLPLADDMCSAAVCVGVFTYISRQLDAIRELLRVTVPGGLVVITHRDDLWSEQDFDRVLDDVRADTTAIDVSGPHPYLPGHPEFGTDIEVKDALLRVR